MWWEIQYHSDGVQGEIRSFPAKLLARYLRMTEILQEYGLRIGMPHTRIMGEGLFELRLKAK